MAMPPHSPFPPSSLSLSTMQECTAHPDRTWLQPILDNEFCPVFLCHTDSSMVPIYTRSLPEDMYWVVSVMFERWGSVHVGSDSNGDLIMLEEAPSGAVVAMVYALTGSIPPFSQLPTTT
ncbi:hypothetical protein BKA82DRAFT_18725 [Pisolithus tinctorius]|uniref:Uncharacterized protein n=1 Tax=Pisolithus tinctorius Marx 270 TaxID=870435 RepID=A0A0C3PGV8_PISTI|nr:hypothetical protein BKA82DRAFT_18725 [Pisolithus tinctorius]KIO13220.1 hypothetical protein M404DRAFT_18725 [Pisolithus tinctorius Marx 270]